MSDEKLLAFLQSQQDEASKYQWGDLANVRRVAIDDYDRAGYPGDDKREGQSKYVDSSVHDAVETLAPDLLDVFHSGDRVCEFTPDREEDEQYAEEATDAAEYIYNGQNDGFIISHTVIKDALQTRLGFVTWYIEDCDKAEITRLKGLTFEQAAYALASIDQEATNRYGPSAKVKIEEHDWSESEETGERVVDLKIRKSWQTKKIRIKPLPADQVLVKDGWTSPILEECPYVCTIERTTLSNIRQMGYKVGLEDAGDDLDGMITHYSDDPLSSGPRESEDSSSIDESLTEVWLYREFALVDYNGDGIAERRKIVRLSGRILENDECSHVPVACVSPYLRQHRWDGFSVWDHLHDIQRNRSATVRDVQDSLSLATRPKKNVLTDVNGQPFANLDDLLDTGIGGINRMTRPDAVTNDVMPWAGQHAMPYLEMQEGWKENRIGLTRYNQGIDADSLNKTASGMQMMLTSSQKRVKLAARIIAECFYVPMFRGILRLMTEGEMPRIAAKIRGAFVEFDPANYRSDYGMTVNVGLGTGDKQTILMGLDRLFMAQQQALPLVGPDGVPVVTSAHLAHTLKLMAENSGFKQPDQFVIDPDSDEAEEFRQKAAQAPPPPPPLEIALQQMKDQATEKDQQREQQFEQSKLQMQQQFEAQQSEADRKNKLLLQQMADMVKMALADSTTTSDIAKIQVKGEEDQKKEVVKAEHHILEKALGGAHAPHETYKAV